METNMNYTVFDLMDGTAFPEDGPSPAHVAALKRINKIMLTTLLILIMVAMGSVVTVKDFKVVLRRPIGAVIGVICQFIFLPLAAFGMAHLMQVERPFAIGMLLTASSPGGATSNLFSYWTDGDVCLSIVMTTVSTVLSLGMLPFNLWLYTREWTQDDNDVLIPYKAIFKALAMILIPVLIGMIIRWKSLKLSKIVAKIGSISGMLAIGCNIAINIAINPDSLRSPWNLWIAMVTLPFIGYLFGFCFSWLLRQPFKQCRTIAFETGCQNIAVTLTIIALSFDGSPDFFDMFTYPNFYGMSLLTEAFIFVAIYKLYVRKCKKANETPDDGGEMKVNENKSDEKSNNYIDDDVKVTDLSV